MSDFQKKRTLKKLFATLYTDYIFCILPVILLDTIIILFILLIISSLISFTTILPTLAGISPDLWMPLLVSSLAFLYRFTKHAASYSVSFVEDAVGMQEMLVTADDTMDEESEILDELRSEILDKARQARSAQMIPFKIVAKKSVICLFWMTLFLFLPLYSSTLSFLPEALPEINWFEDPELVDPLNTDIEFQDPSEIYGEAEQISEGNNRLELVIDRSVGRGDLTNPLAWQNSITQSQSSGGRVNAVLDNPALEQLPEEFGLAKAYNLQIRNIQ